MLKDLGVLAARLLVGLSIASHGAQKQFGWFEGPGPENAGAFFETLGLSPGPRYAQMASISEISGGTLIALGALGPVGPSMLLATMIVAMGAVHVKNGFFAQKGGIELNVVYSAAALLLAMNGPGKLSLDNLTGVARIDTPGRAWLALAAAGAGAGMVLARRTSPGLAATAAVQTSSSHEEEALHTASTPAVDAPQA